MSCCATWARMEFWISILVVTSPGVGVIVGERRVMVIVHRNLLGEGGAGQQAQHHHEDQGLEFHRTFLPLSARVRCRADRLRNREITRQHMLTTWLCQHRLAWLRREGMAARYARSSSAHGILEAARPRGLDRHVVLASANDGVVGIEGRCRPEVDNEAGVLVGTNAKPPWYPPSRRTARSSSDQRCWR